MKTLKLTINDLAEFVGAVLPKGLVAKANEVVGGISTDSRSVMPGEVFVALKGDRFDGHDHIRAAIKNGASAVVAEKKIDGAASKTILVPNSLSALGMMAGSLIKKQAPKVLALTGSNGKTSTKEMIKTILDDGCSVLATEGNLNNEVGLPLTIFKMERNHRSLILEMGMNHYGEISRLTAIAKPDVGLITSLGAAHLEFFGRLENVAKAKGELYLGLKSDAVAVINADEPLLLNVGSKFKGNKLYFGQTDKAQVALKSYKDNGLAGQSFKLVGPGAAKGITVNLALLGRHNAHNALAAAAAALAMGAEWGQIESGLNSVKSFPGRLSVMASPEGWQIIDDCYNANPTSVTAALNLIGALKGRVARAAILGDMLELGPKGPSLHHKVGRLAAESHLDFLAMVGPLSASTMKGALNNGFPKDRVGLFETPIEAAQWLSERLGKKAIVLIKGSRGMKLEGALAFLMNADKKTTESFA